MTLKEEKSFMKRSPKKRTAVAAPAFRGKLWINKQQIHFNFLYKFLQLHAGGLPLGDALGHEDAFKICSGTGLGRGHP